MKRVDQWMKTSRWSETGEAGLLAWGQVRTKGSLRYRVVIDRGTRSSRCTCSSANQPCVHVVALTLCLVEHVLTPDRTDTVPAWVTVPVPVRNGSTAKEPTPGPEAWVTDARITEMQRGYAFLEEWLIRQTDLGWRTLLESDAQAREDIARRLTDLRLPGPARMVRELTGPLPWHEPATHVQRLLGQLWTACRGFRHRDQLSPDEWGDLLMFSGVTIRKEQLKQRPGLRDHWILLHTQEDVDADGLRKRTQWLVGIQGKRIARWVEFAWKRSPLPPAIPEGFAWEGFLHPYPGTGQSRMVPGEGRPVKARWTDLPVRDGWAKVLADLTRERAANPFRTESPVLIRGLRCRTVDGRTRLVDPEGLGLPVFADDLQIRTLFVREDTSGLTLFGLVAGTFMLPMALVGPEGMWPLGPVGPNLEK